MELFGVGLMDLFARFEDHLLDFEFLLDDGGVELFDYVLHFFDAFGSEFCPHQILHVLHYLFLDSLDVFIQLLFQFCLHLFILFP